jgi:carbonic anhydrase
MLPFAWESSLDEPLGKTRAFLAEALATNADYIDTSADLLAKLKAEQHPRATVVACSDSQVQLAAVDRTAENDDYVVRNWGNRVAPGDETIAYGVERIGTPLLLIVGHTGCSAIDEALDVKSKLGEPIRRQITAPGPGDEKEVDDGHGTHDEAMHSAKTPVEAVVANVRHQVDVALGRFGARVQAGRLTVVGAVLDVENALRKGRGRLVVVDVNANRDPKRLEAFLKAVHDGGLEEPVEHTLRRRLR